MDFVWPPVTKSLSLFIQCGLSAPVPFPRNACTDKYVRLWKLDMAVEKGFTELYLSHLTRQLVQMHV